MLYIYRRALLIVFILSSINSNIVSYLVLWSWFVLCPKARILLDSINLDGIGLRFRSRSRAAPMPERDPPLNLKNVRSGCTVCNAWVNIFPTFIPFIVHPHFFNNPFVGTRSTMNTYLFNSIQTKRALNETKNPDSLANSMATNTAITVNPWS